MLIIHNPIQQKKPSRPISSRGDSDSSAALTRSRSLSRFVFRVIACSFGTIALCNCGETTVEDLQALARQAATCYEAQDPKSFLEAEIELIDAALASSKDMKERIIAMKEDPSRQMEVLGVSLRWQAGINQALEILRPASKDKLWGAKCEAEEPQLCADVKLAMMRFTSAALSGTDD